MEERILWGSPLPPIRSGVSDYAVELLPELCRRARVRVLCPPGLGEDECRGLPRGAEVVPHTTRPAPGEVQLIHLGNNPYHAWLLERLAESATVVVLHDLVLHHLLVNTTVARGDPKAFSRHMEAAHGPSGLALAEARRLGISSRLDPFLFPATDAVLGDVSAVVVHSEWARHQLGAIWDHVPVRRVDLCAADPGTIDRLDLRSRLGVLPDDVVIMHLGFLTPEKGSREILAALATATRLGIPARLLLVGEGKGLETIMKAAENLGIVDRVTATGWVDAGELMRLPAAADLGVVIRTPSAGETSAAVLRFLACGTPVALTGLHQFLEVPSEAAPRVCPGAPAAAELSRIIVDAADEISRGSWEKRREVARGVYEKRHQPSRTAAALLEILSDINPDS